MKHPPERPCIVIKDTREPDEAANDHPNAVFRPRVYAPGIPKETPPVDWPRVELQVKRAKLGAGDYSLPGLETMVAIERKSGLDLLGTLFGETEDSVGARHGTLERFRAELARARGFAHFEILCEESPEWVWWEAARRHALYGKSFSPPAAFALLRSFRADFGVSTVWSGGYAAGERWVSGKADAELEVGSFLARVWSQATGGEASRKMRRRGLSVPWLDVLVGKEPAVWTAS